MSLFTAMKNIRRRAVESVFQSVGISETTVDEEFDSMYNCSKEVLQDMNECGAALTSVLRVQKIMFGEARELTSVVHAMYERGLNEKEVWPEGSTKLKHYEAASLWKEKWDKLHDVTRSSAAIVCCDEALDPIKETLNTCIPTIEQDARDRSVILKDFDSFRRRLKALEAKRDAFGDVQSAAAFENQNELNKYQNKVEAAATEYDSLNERLKREMIATKETHDDLIEAMLITFVTAQVHLFSRVAKELDEILRYFPANQVREIRSRIDSYESQGGVEAVLREKTNARKIFEIAVGKAVPSDFKRAPEAVEAVAIPQEVKASGGGTFKQVQAIYGYKANDKDELTFEKGAIIDVLDDSDSGWWRGRMGGREGVFPANYVTPLSSNNSITKGTGSAASATVKIGGGGSGPVATATQVAGPRNSNTTSLATAATTKSPTIANQSNLKPAGTSVQSPQKVTTPVAPNPPRGNLKPVTVAKKIAIALFAYEASDADELSFAKGTTIQVLDDTESGWWRGKIGVNEGMFPANYVKMS